MPGHSTSYIPNVRNPSASTVVQSPIPAVVHGSQCSNDSVTVPPTIFSGALHDKTTSLPLTVAERSITASSPSASVISISASGVTSFAATSSASEDTAATTFSISPSARVGVYSIINVRSSPESNVSVISGMSAPLTVTFSVNGALAVLPLLATVTGIETGHPRRARTGADIFTPKSFPGISVTRMLSIATIAFSSPANPLKRILI